MVHPERGDWLLETEWPADIREVWQPEGYELWMRVCETLCMKNTNILAQVLSAQDFCKMSDALGTESMYHPRNALPCPPWVHIDLPSADNVLCDSPGAAECAQG